jgi:uncharacterized damage-inducible protein DinB
MYQLLASQYESIKDARQALFRYCEGIENTSLFKKHDTFNKSSISDLLVHNVNTYLSWLRNFGLDTVRPFHITEEVNSLKEIRVLFDEVNLIVDEFLHKYSDDYEQPLTKKIVHKGITATLTPLKLFTHVITHEFHHKGQILTMSRQLGYTPADTDVIRF